MSLSPRKKKMKPDEEGKREVAGHIGLVDSVAHSSSKKAKIEDNVNNVTTDVQALKRKNFVSACEQVSYNSYFDFGTRLQLVYLPPCMNADTCSHLNAGKIVNIMPIADYAEESIKIELNTYTWCEALEICQLCLTPEQYLSANILKEIVEIILNAQEDNMADYSIDHLIDRCQQILSQNFSLHPPCIMKTLRNLYNSFLTSPMGRKEKTYSNRNQFGCDKGIVKYCMNRLEYELNVESKDDAIVDKDENMPEEMTKSVKGLHWQKEKFEIFEILERPERVRRLLAVLESLIELLQFDLAIWHSRYKNNLGSHVMRSHKPLMAFVLWSNNILYTGAVNNNCRQIISLFINMVHLQYPDEAIHIMSTWLNVIIQTFYICENDSNSDYPNTGKYCAGFAKEFYKILAGMPERTIIRVLEKIYPTFMQHLIGLLHVQNLLTTNENEIINIFTRFIKEEQWNRFPESESEIKITKNSLIKAKPVKDFMTYLAKVCKNARISEDSCETVYPKLDPESLVSDTIVDRSHVVHTLYITMNAYLDAFNVQSVQETLENLNEQLFIQGVSNTMHTDFIPENTSYLVTENFIKKYRSIYRNLTELIGAMQELNTDDVPEIKIFERIGLL